MPILSKPKHERFAQEVAKGKTAEEAYTLAGYAPSLKNAQRLKSSEGVRARVQELLSRVAERTKKSIEDILAQLDEDREFARDCQQPAAALSATMGQAKVLGYLREKIEHTGEDGGPIKASIKVTFVKPGN